MRAQKLLQNLRNGMAGVEKRLKLMNTTIVVWLVLVVLALNVVAFVARFIDRCRLAHGRSIASEGSICVAQTREPAMLRHGQEQVKHG